MAPTMDDVWTFANFRPGHSFGSMKIMLDQARLEQWQSIYGGNQVADPTLPSGMLPEGLLVTCMMEAYLHLVQPRPPGNIHASQKIMFAKARPRIGDTLTLSISCLDKTEKKGRGWVTFEASVDCDGHALLRGEIRTVWAQ